MCRVTYRFYLQSLFLYNDNKEGTQEFIHDTQFWYGLSIRFYLRRVLVRLH